MASSTGRKLLTNPTYLSFQGRLGDLGKIDDKYDVAVTTACGGSLNSLICDTIKQGEAVIDVLRKRKLGRANIMGLDKLPSRDLSPIETPENVPRLFDLVTPRDARFAPAFFKATGNTVVAENLEQANRIAYGKKRWRVVTLGGDLIDTSGAMSGGGTRVQRGGMSSKFASEKVESAVVAKYDRESEQAMGELTEFTGTRKAVEAEVQSLQRRIPEVEIAMSKIELDVRNGGKRVAEAEKRVRELKSVVSPSPSL
jgi:structural maintenance of chromosome 4